MYVGMYMNKNPLGTIYRRESMPLSYFVSSFTVKKTRASMTESIPDEMSVVGVGAQGFGGKLSDNDR